MPVLHDAQSRPRWDNEASDGWRARARRVVKRRFCCRRGPAAAAAAARETLEAPVKADSPDSPRAFQDGGWRAECQGGRGGAQKALLSAARPGGWTFSWRAMQHECSRIEIKRDDEMEVRA